MDGIIQHLTFLFYITLIVIYNLFYIVIFVGLTNKQQVVFYAKQLNYFIHCFIALFLILRFNPFGLPKKHVLSENDTTIIFSSGIFLLVNLGIFQLIELYLNQTVFHGSLPTLPQLH